MRKIISALALSLLGLMLAFGVFAQITPPAEITKCTMRHTLSGFTGMTCPAAGNPCPYTDPNCGPCCLLDTIYTVTDWVFYIILAIVIILIIWGAYMIMTAAGAPEKITSGRNFIIWACVGLIIALLARSIPSIARAIVGAG
jgi:FtsH-binding integral membrane protein